MMICRAKNVSVVAPQEKRKKHRLKLLKKIQENRMRSKAMVNHVPTDQVQNFNLVRYKNFPFGILIIIKHLVECYEVFTFIN